MSGFIKVIQKALATRLADYIIGGLLVILSGAFITGFGDFFFGRLMVTTGFILILSLFAMVGVAVGLERVWNAVRAQEGIQVTLAKAEILNNIYAASEIVLAKISDIEAGNLSDNPLKLKQYTSEFLGDINRLEMLITRHAPNSIELINVTRKEAIRIALRGAHSEAGTLRDNINDTLISVEQERK